MVDQAAVSCAEVRPVEWAGGVLRILDQRELPGRVVHLECRSLDEVAGAIRGMAVRGAPAIGVVAAFALALHANAHAAAPAGEFRRRMEEGAAVLAATRPTAVNLFWGIERMLQKVRQGAHPTELEAEARGIAAADEAANRRLGEYGAALLPAGARVLTHCNAGALATSGYGTALGIVRAAAAAGKLAGVYADETRPFLQGARLTAWELEREGIPVTLNVDGAAGYLMQRGMVDAVVVGADRITARGDVANKIGTYALAVLAEAHGLPFYVAAPLSTVDLRLETGDQITIEERDAAEVRGFGGVMVAPAGVAVFNPAFDVTPARLVTAIVTEAGVVRPPYRDGLRRAFGLDQGG